MPAGQGKDAEQFAAAVEQGRSPRTCGDEELARDLEIVAMLRTRAREFDPSPAAKAQAKQKLMALLAETAAETRPVPGRLLAPPFPASDLGSPDQAVTELLTQVTATGSPPDGPQPVGTRSVEPQSAEPGSAEATRLDLDTDIDGGTDVESAPGSTEQSTAHGTPTRPTRSRRLAGGRHSMPSRPAGRAGDPRRVGASGRRFTLVGSAALVLALALAGAGILASREALPGDGLYAVKRVSESAGLALTFDEVSRAHRHLDLASTRLGEVEQLVAADPRVSTDDPELVTSAIQEFDDSTGEGARILLADGASDDSVRADLRTWAAEQSARLAELKPALPTGTEAENALQLLNRVAGRSEALQGRSACATPPQRVDDLGPVPTCGPAATGAGPTLDPTGTLGGLAPAGPLDDPTNGARSGSPDARTGSGGTAGGGTSTSPDTSPRTPADSSEPGLLDPVEDTLDGVLGGGSSDDGSSGSSTAPKSDDDGDSSDNGGGGSGGGGGGLLPPVEVPPLLPGLPGLSL